MQILPYSPSDNQAVAKFFREIFQENDWKERPSDYMDQLSLLFHLPEGGGLLLVKENNNLIGTGGIVLRNKDEALMKRFYIKQSYRGSGVAQNLLNELLELAKSIGAKKVVLDVSKNNTRAVRFYEKSGFLPTSVIPAQDWPESNLPESHFYFYKNIN